MNITVVGMGYVGLSNAVLLAQKNDVTIFDIDTERINLINKKISPINDEGITLFLQEKNLSLKAATNANSAFKKADLVIIATPTDYDIETQYFNTQSVDETIQAVLKVNPQATLVIKSTVPIGYTEKLCHQYNTQNILFSPEFLREGNALYDNLNPSRIVVGSLNCSLNGSLNNQDNQRAKEFVALLLDGAEKEDIPIFYTGTTEAEAIKLFSNAYLAMRVAYMNEIDSFCEIKNLNAKQVIDGVCADSRIGNHYNNPSFGYGGYCLPKDTKQLQTNYNDVPNSIIGAIVESNEVRKDFITQAIMARSPKTVGVYNLTMKSQSDNFRASSILCVIERLITEGVNVVIHEPLLDIDTFLGARVESNIYKFKQQSDVIITNRMDTELDDVASKVYTRDIYFRD